MKPNQRRKSTKAFLTDLPELSRAVLSAHNPRRISNVSALDWKPQNGPRDGSNSNRFLLAPILSDSTERRNDEVEAMLLVMGKQDTFPVSDQSNLFSSSHALTQQLSHPDVETRIKQLQGRLTKIKNATSGMKTNELSNFNEDVKTPDIASLSPIRKIAPTTRQRQTARHIIMDKIERFRSDEASRLEFETSIQEVMKVRHEKIQAKLALNNVQENNMNDLWMWTPEMKEKRLQAMVQTAEERHNNAHDKRGVIRAWRLERKLQILEAPVVRKMEQQSLVEIHTWIRAWSAFIVCARFQTKLVAAATHTRDQEKNGTAASNPLESGKGKLRQAAAILTKSPISLNLRAKRPPKIVTSEERLKLIMMIQLTWRLHRAHRNHQRKVKSIKLIHNSLLQMNPLIRFLIAVRKYKHYIVKVQRQFRYRRIAHELRMLIAGLRLASIIDGKGMTSRIPMKTRLPYIHQYVQEVEQEYSEAVYEYGKELKHYHLAVEDARWEAMYSKGERTTLVPNKPLPPPPRIIPPIDDMHKVFFEILENVQK